MSRRFRDGRSRAERAGDGVAGPGALATSPEATASPSVIADVVRVDTARWSRFRLFAALAPGIGVVARRADSMTVKVGALVLTVVGLAALLSARRSLKRRTLVVTRGQLHLGDGGPVVAREDVTSWTLDGRVARVYTVPAGWTLRTRTPDLLRPLLVRGFGQPLRLERRGSKRARIIAATVSVAGVALTVLGAVFEVAPLFFVGLPCALFGFATCGALSQKVARL